MGISPPTFPLRQRGMKRKLAFATTGLLLTMLAGCAGDEAPAAAVPEVYVAEVIQQDVPIYMEIVGQTRGSP